MPSLASARYSLPSGSLDGPSRTIRVEPLQVPVPPRRIEPEPQRERRQEPDRPREPKRPREPAR